MGVSKSFSLWFTIPSEQGCCGCTDWSRTYHCKTPHNWRAFLPPLISFPPMESWVKASTTQKCSTAGISAQYWWHDGMVQGQMGYTTTAGLVMPCLTCPCCCDESALCLLRMKTISAGVLPSWSQGCTPVWPCVHSMHSWKECLGCSKGPAKIFRMHTYLLNMPTNYSSIS